MKLSTPHAEGRKEGDGDWQEVHRKENGTRTIGAGASILRDCLGDSVCDLADSSHAGNNHQLKKAHTERASPLKTYQRFCLSISCKV